jgi:hypothetical protein
MGSFFKPKSIAERLADEAKLLREQAKLLPPGVVQDAAIRAARQTDVTAHLGDWVNSPGLQPPRR